MKPIKPVEAKHRTPTVISLCQSMREAGDYSAMPILADALEEANYDDDDTLGVLRAGVTDPTEAERFNALILSDETARAVANVEHLAAELGPPGYYDDDDRSDGEMSYARLMEAAKEYATSVERGEDGKYLHMGTNEEYKDRDLKSFWQAYQLITGRTVADDDASFFSCSC